MYNVLTRPHFKGARTAKQAGDLSDRVGNVTGIDELSQRGASRTDSDNIRDMRTYDVLGVPISVTSPIHAAETIERWAEDDVGRYVCIRDVASLMTIVDDPRCTGIHEHAAMITPDGAPIAAIGRLSGLPVRRTCGPDLMALVCERSIDKGLSHFFYGGKEGVAEELAAKLCARHPGLRVKGVYSPPFRELTEDEDEELIKFLVHSEADIIWVGISSPKQDLWMRDHFSRLPQTLIGVGAAFDFLSGAVRRAPLWMRRLGIEWLFRLAMEPRRLWRRYLILAPLFCWRSAGQLVSNVRLRR